MRIELTRECNLLNIHGLAKYLQSDADELVGYYKELLDDKRLLDGVNDCIVNAVENFGFTKGLFGKGTVDSIDWFAYQRVLIYVLVRHLKPKHLLETGVYYGGNTVFLLAAVNKNQCGTLHSIDLPDSKIRAISNVNDGKHDTLARHSLVGDSELYDESLSPGFIIPDYLKDQWDFIEGNSVEVIPSMNYQFDFYIHDSDHSFRFLNREISAAMKKMNEDAIVIVDDLNWSNAFFKFCVEWELYPLFATDNGKDSLMVRTGIVKLDHPNNGNKDITGGKL